jgi:hypothetical protein
MADSGHELDPGSAGSRGWEPFELFVRELGEVLSFDTLSKFDATSATFHGYAGPGFEKLGEELKRIYAENVKRNTAESQLLAVWVSGNRRSRSGRHPPGA